MGEEGGVYHAARLRRDSRVEADDIAGRKQFAEREIGYGKGLSVSGSFLWAES